MIFELTFTYKEMRALGYIERVYLVVVGIISIAFPHFSEVPHKTFGVDVEDLQQLILSEYVHHQVHNPLG